MDHHWFCDNITSTNFGIISGCWPSTFVDFIFSQPEVQILSHGIRKNQIILHSVFLFLNFPLLDKSWISDFGSV